VRLGSEMPDPRSFRENLLWAYADNIGQTGHGSAPTVLPRLPNLTATASTIRRLRPLTWPVEDAPTSVVRVAFVGGLGGEALSGHPSVRPSRLPSWPGATFGRAVDADSSPPTPRRATAILPPNGFEVITWLDPPLLIGRGAAGTSYDVTIAGRPTVLDVPLKGPDSIRDREEKGSWRTIAEFPGPPLVEPVARGGWISIRNSVQPQGNPLISRRDPAQMNRPGEATARPKRRLWRS
jgi:hypothetical protein